MNLRGALANARNGLFLLPWAALVAAALRMGSYGLDEEGAKALLVAWSIGDQVASAAFTLGAPDIRLFLFLPLGFIWPGQVIAARVATLAAMAIAGIALYGWRRRDDQTEAALLATGVLLIAPLTIESINALSGAPLLLAIYGAAVHLHRRMSGEGGAFNGWFFIHLLACAASVSLHPAGLAYPVLLVRTWWAEPPDQPHRTNFLVGIPLVVLLVLTMRLGWPGLVWGQNPLAAATAVYGGANAASAQWLGGLAVLTLVAVVGWHERRRLLADLTGGMLLLGVVFGAVAADRTWEMLVLALLLYGGIPWLLRLCARFAGRGLFVQRGWLWLVLLLICTAFMRTNRSDYDASRNNLLSVQDALINEFAQGIDALRSDNRAVVHPAATLLVASSWPARTSIACRCDGLPLPPAADDPQKQLAMMRGVSYLILGGADTDHRALTQNFAQLGSRIEILSKQPGGVVLHIKQP